jgi:hypothetical protein
MKWLIYAAAAVLLVLHQDFWNWGKIGPFAFGFLPIGLAYHAAFAVACAVMMALLVAVAWPKHLEDVQPEPGVKQDDSHH